MVRKIFAVIILFSIIYFIGGWFAIKINFITEETYFNYAGIVGGLASIVGLFALTKPSLTRNDLKELELEQLKTLTKTSEDLEKLEKTKHKTVTEIDDLKYKKQEMEILVKKASTALFLKEEHSKLETNIKSFIESNTEIKDGLLKIDEINIKLKILNEEIENDPNVKLLNSVINSAKKKDDYNELIRELPPITRVLFLFFKDINKAMLEVVRIISR